MVLGGQTATVSVPHHLVEGAFGADGQQLGGRAVLVQHALGPLAVRVVNEVVRLGLGGGAHRGH